MSESGSSSVRDFWQEELKTYSPMGAIMWFAIYIQDLVIYGGVELLLHD